MTSTITPPDRSRSAAKASDSPPWDGNHVAGSEVATAELPSRGGARWAAALAAPIGPLWHRTWFRACVLAVVLVLAAVPVAMTLAPDEPAGVRSHAARVSPPPVVTMNPHAGVANRVAPGWAFQLGHFRVQHGWHIASYGAGMAYVINSLSVRNTSRVSRSFAVDIKLSQGPNRVVADLSCSAVSVPAHRTVQVVCRPDGSGARYDRVTIENTY